MWTSTRTSRHRRAVLYIIVSLIFLVSLLNVRPVKPPGVSFKIPLPRPPSNKVSLFRSDNNDLHGHTLGWPREFADAAQEEPKFCAERFTSGYLERLRDSATGYCTPDSPANLTCFHSRTAGSRIDSFCVSKSATFEPSEEKYRLPCQERTRTADDRSREIPAVEDFAPYWYNTGPSSIFTDFIRLDGAHEKAPRTQNYSVLIKREGAGNPWHSLMEIFSMTMTLDVLRMTPEPQTRRPFLAADDAENTQIVILDNDEDGPYFDLWGLLARKPIIRIKDMPEGTVFENIIVPLPGGSNPMWQGDWEEHSCHTADLLRAFSSRTTEFYGIAAQPRRRTRDLVVTIIDRKETRRLIDQDAYVEELGRQSQHVTIQTVDFASIPFKEQLEIAQRTDILIGVHGAGLTHAMFLPSNSAIVEILPAGLEHKGFRNLAGLLGHAYYSVHGAEPSGPKGDGWQGKNIFLEKKRFIDLVGAATRGLRWSREKL